MVVILGAVLVIAGLMNFRRRDVAYALVILWALAGIAAKFPQEGVVTVATCHLWPGGRQPARGLPDQKKKSLK